MTLLLFEQLRPEKGIPYSRQHIHRLIKESKFPKPVKLGDGGRNAWVDSEIDEYIDQQVAKRDGRAA